MELLERSKQIVGYNLKCCKIVFNVSGYGNENEQWKWEW